jgi:glycosyltransferase involved in cell wall biosynthesis
VVLSSVWDALPTVLIEALALGTPVVSADCGAGPREILGGGRYGLLVPPRDPLALASALARTLADPLPRETLMLGGQRYEVERNADLYLKLMLGPGNGCDGG